MTDEEKKIEVKLTKREIEVILNLMGLGKTFAITHGDPEYRERKFSGDVEISHKQEKIINIDKLEERLRKKMKMI